MHPSVHHWDRLLLIQSSDIGLALAVAGLLYLYLGRRLGRSLVMANYAAVGGLACATLASQMNITGAGAWTFVVFGVVVLGYASWKWQHLATVLAGGGVGALLIGAGFAWLDASERVVILTQIVVFITFVALGSVLVNKTLIILTSVEGAFLFAAGMIILLHVRTSPLYYFSNFVDQTGWFTGFTIFSATVIGICVQLAGASAEKHHGKM